MAEAQGTILEGVTEKTRKDELLKRLREAAKQLAQREDDRVGRLQAIEERVRSKYAASGQQANLRNVMVVASVQEFAEAADFLENFDDLLPVALTRVMEGAIAASETAKP